MLDTLSQMTSHKHLVWLCTATTSHSCLLVPHSVTLKQMAVILKSSQGSSLTQMIFSMKRLDSNICTVPSPVQREALSQLEWEISMSTGGSPSVGVDPPDVS